MPHLQKIVFDTVSFIKGGPKLESGYRIPERGAKLANVSSRRVVAIQPDVFCPTAAVAPMFNYAR